MNLGTDNLYKAGCIAQDLANIRRRPVAVFIPATGIGGPYWADSCPPWLDEEHWLENMYTTKASVYYPKENAASK